MPGSPYTLTTTVDTPQKSLAHARPSEIHQNVQNLRCRQQQLCGCWESCFPRALRNSVRVLSWLNSPQTFQISWCHQGKAANTCVFMSSPKDELLTGQTLQRRRRGKNKHSRFRTISIITGDGDTGDTHLPPHAANKGLRCKQIKVHFTDTFKRLVQIYWNKPI